MMEIQATTAKGRSSTKAPASRRENNTTVVNINTDHNPVAKDFPPPRGTIKLDVRFVGEELFV